MAYGKKYVCLFDTFDSVRNTLEIHKKDYSGEVTYVTGAKNPVKHTWSDEPQPPIKGSSIEIRLMNIDGDLPLDSFYSTNDNEYLVKYFVESSLLFTGYLVQDDFDEEVTGLTHQIKLSANDGIGLLREIPLPNITPSTGKISLLNILSQALFATNLSLPLDVYCELQVVSGSTGRWLEDAFLDVNTFYNGSEFDTAYNVLEKILKRFRATLMQANGRWVIVRWDALRIYSGSIPGFSYNPVTFLGITVYGYNAPITFDSTGYQVGDGEPTIPLYSLTESLHRPYKFVKEQFDYKPPGEVLLNASFNRVGALRTSYSSLGNTIYEYQMADWDVGHGWNTAGTAYLASSCDRFIRVVKNSFGEEIDRYGVITGSTGGVGQPFGADSSPIEVQQGERIRISFDVRTNTPNSGNRYFYFTIITTASPAPRSLNNRNLNSDGTWTYNGSIYLGGVEHSEWHTVSVESEPIPVDGILVIKLAQNNLSNAETQYKNFRFEIYRSVIHNRWAIGHIHSDTQAPVINNSDKSTIEIDISPNNSLSGTLFLSSFTGPVRDRVKLVRRGTSATQFLLGEITTTDQLFIRRKQRVQLEGTLIGLQQGSSNLTPLALMLFTAYPGLRFIWGRCEIDYKENKVTGTLHERYEAGEVDSDLTSTYNLEYIYNKS